MFQYWEWMPNRSVEIIEEFHKNGEVGDGFAIFYKGWVRTVCPYNEYLEFKKRSELRYRIFHAAERKTLSRSERDEIIRRMSILISKSYGGNPYSYPVKERNSHIVIKPFHSCRIHSCRHSCRITFNESLRMIDGEALKITIDEKDSRDSSSFFIMRKSGEVSVIRSLHGLKVAWGIKALVRRELRSGNRDV